MRALCRQACLALLVVCLIVQPVIAGQGALHEAIGHPDTAVHHGNLHAMHSSADLNEPEGETGASHQLMHHAHCCAQPQLPASALGPLPMFERVAITDWLLAHAAAADAYAASPFRPPIQA